MSNLKLIEDYLKELEQENMSVADSTHADPLSAQEGAKQVYENDPRLKAYRNRQAQGRYLKDTGSSAGNLISDIATGLSDAAPLDTIKEAAKLWSAQENKKLYTDAYKTASKLFTPTQENDTAFELANSQRQDYVDALLADQAAEQFERNAARSPEFSESSFGGESWFGDPLTRGAAYDFGRYSIPGTAASIGTSILTRSPALGAAAFTAPVGSQSYYGSDKGHEQAKKDAFFDMASEYLFERLQLGNLLASGKGIVSKALSQGGLESVQEGMVGIAQLVRDIVQTNENLTPESFTEQLSGRIGEVAPAVKLGFGAGTATGLGYSSAESLLNSRNASGGQQPTPEQVISQVPSVDPSAIQEPYSTTPSVDVVDDSIDMRRRKFLGDMRDIATVATTNPTDLLPGLGEVAAPATVETAVPVVAPKAVISYSNPPVPTDFVFDINGKTVYAMAPGTADVEQGDTFVQFSDPDGGSNLPEGAPDYVDIKDYLDPEKEISQVEIDRAIARAIQDNFINDGDEFFLGDVRRYYDEAGNNAEPATFEQIEQMEGMNDPEGVFDEIMLNQFPSAYLGPGERFPSPDSAPRQIKKLGGYSRIESKPTSEPRLRKDPGSNSVSPFESRVEKEALLIQEREKTQQLSKDREVTDAIPRIPVLDRRLSEARDRLKSLEAGNPPPGFEDDYTQEEIEEDIRLEKDNIESLEEEIAIKQEEPIEAESKEVDDAPSVEAEAQIPIYGTGKDDAKTLPGIPKQININKKSGERSVEFYGAEAIPDFDIEKIANRIDVKGKGKNKIRIQFAYAPRVMPDGFTTGDRNVDTSGNSYGKAIAIREVNDTIDIIINQARFSEEGSQQLIDKVAKRLGVTNAEIESLMLPGENKAEFAARITIQHELAHANHFIWELMALGKTGYSTSNKDVSRFRSDLYKAFRKDILDFMKRDGATAFRRLGFGDDVKTNKQLIDQLDRAFSTTERVKNETSLESTARINKATSDLWTVFTELAAYGSEKDIKGKETFIQKFKRVVKMILAKMGINIDKSKLDDVDFNNSFEAFRRDMQTPGDVNTETLASKIADSAVWGKEEVDIPADRTKELEDAIQSKKDSSEKRKPATFNVNRLNKVIEIARGVGATNRILTTLREGISLEEEFNSPKDIAGILKETTDIPYSNIDLQKTLAFLSQMEPEYYSEINTMTEALRLMYNYEVLPGARDDIQAGDIISEIEEIVTDYIKVPIENADNLDELANQTLEDRPDKLLKTDMKSEDSTELINSNEELEKRVLELRSQGFKLKEIYSILKNEVKPSPPRRPNNITYRTKSLYREINAILQDNGVQRRETWLEPFVFDGKKISQAEESRKEIRALGNIAELKKDSGARLTDKEEYDLRLYNEQKRRGSLAQKKIRSDKKLLSGDSRRKGEEWWRGADKLPQSEQKVLAEQKAYANYHALRSRSKIRQFETVDGKEKKIKGAKHVGNVFLGIGNAKEEAKIMDLFIEAAMKTMREQSPYHVDHIIPFGSPRLVDGKPRGGYKTDREMDAEAKGVGLSTSANLQILPGAYNMSKRNIISQEKINKIEFDTNSWVQAWAEPPKKKGNAKKTNAFEDVVSQQTGVDPNNKDDYNSTGAAYTDPLEQEQRSQDDKAQSEYTGEKEVSRPQARERTTLRSLWGFMYSQSAQTVRRHSGASPTAGVIADTILRAPHEKLREKETKSGRDYVQKKSMAQGQFRMEFQEALDQLTNSGGVISLKVNQQLKDYFNNGTLPANGRVAAAARKLKDAAEKLYSWSEKVGTKYTEDFSLRPLDGGTFPRVYDTEKVASPEGRQKLFDLLASIGIKDNAEAGTYEATDAYNIILESGGFVSGDFTTPARQSQATMKQQEELFNFIERSISRDQLGDLLLTDFQGIVPRFVDKATEMTVYAELFGHRGEHLSELKDKVKQEIVDYNRNSKDVRVDPERVLGDITDLVDILHHRYKADLIPTGGRKFLQAAMNATTMASLTLVSLASMPEFLTATALGSKNPAKFATNLLGGATFAALRGLNGMNKFLTGTVGKGYFDPKTNIGKRAKMLRQLGLFDIASLGEAAAQRYVGPNFIKSGVGTSTNSLPLKTLYKMYGLGNLEKGRFRARQLRAGANMDVYFELTLLTTLTQMQQMMALNNFRQTLVADAKSLSKAGKGKGFKLDSTISQIKSNLKTYGLSNREIKELVRWYEAGHRELHDIPGEFKLDLAGPAQRFVQTAITLPSEGSLPKVFRNPAFAPFLLFKSFITTFGNTFINTAAQRIRFAEGEGAAKKYQQGKQIAGMTATAAAMYGAVQFALALGYLIKYGEDENPWEEKTPDWAKFLQDFERTGLFGPLGSVVVQTATPNYWSWKGKDPFDDILDHMIGPIGKQLSNIGQTAADVAQGKDADLEGRLARSIPLTKSEPIRSALGIEPYYTEDDKGKMVRRRTLEKREEKKAEKEKAKNQTILDSITDRAVKELGLSKEEIIGLSRSELDEHMRKEFGFDPDGRKSKASMINEFLESKGASEEEFMASPESEAYKKKKAELQSTRDEASKFVKGMSKADKRKEWEKMKGMTNKQFDEYVELEYGLLLDGRKNRAAMEGQFLELIKDLE